MAKKKPADRVSVSGTWFAMPTEFLGSRACAELSPHATKLLVDFMAGLKANAYGNGRLSATADNLKARGWRSLTTARAALGELIDAGLVVVTQRGGRRKCSLYAVTLWPMHCDFSNLDHGPGAYTTRDWCARPDRVTKPTEDEPAVWAEPRAGTMRAPAKGANDGELHPLRVRSTNRNTKYAPATGTQTMVQPKVMHPPRGTYLDTPSAVCEQAAQTGMGHILRRARPPTRPPTYTTARARFTIPTN